MSKLENIAPSSLSPCPSPCPCYLADDSVLTGSEHCRITQVNTETGRYYLTPEGNKYPSATTVVGILNQKHIDAWIARVGEEEAEKIKAEAGEHGTRWHELMESTLFHGAHTLPWTHEFGRIYPKIVSGVFPHISNVRAVECQMYSDKLRMAGTVDLIAEYDGVLSIIDWKTTRREKEETKAASYWCQTASYAVMAWERFKIAPKQLVLVFNEGDNDFYVYKQDVNRWIPRVAKVRKLFEQLRGY